MKGFLVVLLLAAGIIHFNEGFFHSGKRSMMKVGLYKKTSCFLNLINNGVCQNHCYGLSENRWNQLIANIKIKHACCNLDPELPFYFVLIFLNSEWLKNFLYSVESARFFRQTNWSVRPSVVKGSYWFFPIAKTTLLYRSLWHQIIKPSNLLVWEQFITLTNPTHGKITKELSNQW